MKYKLNETENVIVYTSFSSRHCDTFFCTVSYTLRCLVMQKMIETQSFNFFGDIIRKTCLNLINQVLILTRVLYRCKIHKC